MSSTNSIPSQNIVLKCDGRSSEGTQRINFGNTLDHLRSGAPVRLHSMPEAPVASGRTGKGTETVTETETVYTEFFVDPTEIIKSHSSLQIRDQSLGHKTTRHKINSTCLDSNGIITSRIEETITVCTAPRDGPQAIGRLINFPAEDRSMSSFDNTTSFSDKLQQNRSRDNLETDHRRSRSQSPASRRTKIQEDLSSPTRRRSLSQDSSPKWQKISQHSLDIIDNSAPNFYGRLPRGEVSPSSRCLNGNACPKSLSRKFAKEFVPFRTEAGSMKQSDDYVNSDDSVNRPVPITDDVTIPSFGGATVSSRRNVPLPSEEIHEVSDPKLRKNSTGRGTASTRRQNQNDESDPTFKRTGPGTAYRQRKTLPSSTRKRSMPSDNICNESFCPYVNYSGGVRSNIQRQSMPSQNIHEESQPTFDTTGRRTAYSRRESMPSQYINDELDPTFESTGPGTAYSQRQFIAAASLWNESEHTFKCFSPVTAHRQTKALPSSTRRQSMPSDNICNESSCPYVNYSGGVPTNVQRQSMPSQNINDESAPTFESTGPGTASAQRQSMPSQNENDESEPTFETAGPGTAYSQRESMPSQYINDESAPTFESTGPGTASAQKQFMPSQNVNDESEPTFENTDLRTAYSQRQSMAAENPWHESEPTLDSSSPRTAHRQGKALPSSTRRQSMPSDNKCNESCPNVNYSGGVPSNVQRQSIPSQYINDETAATFETNGPGTEYWESSYMGIAALTRCMPCQNINNIPDLTFESTGREYSQNQYLPVEEIRIQRKSMPSANMWNESEHTSPGPVKNRWQCLCLTEDVSRTRDKTSPNESLASELEQSTTDEPEHLYDCQNICDESVLPTATRTRGTATNDFVDHAIIFENENCERNDYIGMDDEWVPEYDAVRGVIRRRTSRGQQVSIPLPNISARRYATGERLAEETKLSFGDVSGAARITDRPMKTIPYYCYDSFDKSEPSGASESFLNEETRPSFVAMRSSSRRSTTMSLASRNIFDESEPSRVKESYQNDGGRRPTATLRDTLLGETSDWTYRQCLPVNESRRETRQPLREPGKFMMAAKPTGNNGLEGYERIEDKTTPSCGENSKSGRGPLSYMPTQDVSGVTPMSNCAALIKECMENLRSQVSPMSNEWLENKTIPPLPLVSEQLQSTAYRPTEFLGRPMQQRSPDMSYPTWMLGNITAPKHLTDTYGNQSYMCEGKQGQSQSHPWTDGMAHSRTDQLKDVSMSTFNNPSVTPQHMLQMPKTCLDIATETPIQRRCQSLEHTPSENDSESDFFTCSSCTDLGQDDIGDTPCGKIVQSVTKTSTNIPNVPCVCPTGDSFTGYSSSKQECKDDDWRAGSITYQQSQSGDSAASATPSHDCFPSSESQFTSELKFHPFNEDVLAGNGGTHAPHHKEDAGPHHNGYKSKQETQRNNDYRSPRSPISNFSHSSANRPPCWVYPSPIRMIFDGLVRLGESV